MGVENDSTPNDNGKNKGNIDIYVASPMHKYIPPK